MQTLLNFSQATFDLCGTACKPWPTERRYRKLVWIPPSLIGWMSSTVDSIGTAPHQTALTSLLPAPSIIKRAQGAQLIPATKLQERSRPWRHICSQHWVPLHRYFQHIPLTLWRPPLFHEVCGKVTKRLQNHGLKSWWKFRKNLFSDILWTTKTLHQFAC